MDDGVLDKKKIEDFCNRAPANLEENLGTRYPLHKELGKWSCWIEIPTQTLEKQKGPRTQNYGVLHDGRW